MEKDKARNAARDLQLVLSAESAPVYFHGETMAPFLREGDLLRVGPVAWNELRSGDIVTYRDELRYPTQRIVKLRRMRREALIRGDGMHRYQMIVVPSSDILGRVEARRRDGKWLRRRDNEWLAVTRRVMAAWRKEAADLQFWRFDPRNIVRMIAQEPQKTTYITPPFGIQTGLSELLRYPELLYFLVWRQFKIRYKQTLIGALWAILQPLLTLIVFTILFARIGNLPTNGISPPLFYYTGVISWLYFASVQRNATNIVVEHRTIIGRVYFPRLLLPISVVLASLIDFGIMLVGLLVLIMINGPHVELVFLPLVVGWLTIASFSIGIWLSGLNALYRDVQYVVPFFISLGIFVSPVFYPASLLPEAWHWGYGLNPIAGVIGVMRWSVSGQAAPSMPLIISSLCSSLALSIVGILLFQRLQLSFADRLG